MATRGEQKLDEKKLQKAVESWVKSHRAKVQNQKMQSAVDDFVKQHRKEVGDRGMRIIRRVIAEGRTTPTVKSKTPTRGSSLRTEDRRPKVTKQGVEKMVKTATDKAKPAISAASRVGKIAKGMTGIGAALTASEVGAGSDVVPAGRRDEFVKKMDAERRAKQDKKDTSDNQKKRSVQRDALKNIADKKHVDAATKANKADKERPKTYKIKKGDTLSEIAQKHGLKTDELAKKNDIADKHKIYAGRTLKLNKGGYANCGASMAPTQMSTKKVK